MKILLHACCGPCSVKCAESLLAEDIRPALFWYNPNIHPVTEYLSRKNALAQYAGAAGLELIQRDEYGLRPFIAGIFPDFDRRCDYCYRLRLDAAASYGAQHGYEAFCTTLLISPYQNHDRIRAIASQISERRRIPFLYRDFRPLFREGQQAARRMGLYMQKYCGCIFSEEDRYIRRPAARPQ
ncbi:MAG: epoxyqueuosine reductase QueH [Peptococcaceae bacterium]|jgi:predicted adenine nucleotide alpha hydrolase (AANH) superfamily ATPase|nr:epoxyqueuosine reductase QueH [Peptococcaceae bacterium]